MKAKNVLCFSVIFFILVFWGGKAVPQGQLPEYSAIEARLHIGEEAIVKGTVLHLKYYRPWKPNKKKIIFLNIDGKFPDHPFTAVIFEEYFSKFPNFARIREMYENKTVRIRGTIEEYKGKPQIVLTSQDQIKIVQPRKKS